jgi:uncharacterized protein YndB with AHSA1/START domain
MKKVLKIIGIILLVVILFILIAGVFVSKTVHLEKEITINAPRDTVWNYVSSLQGQLKWSPWPERDPDIQASFDGQEGAVGSVYRWKGNKDVGSGNQTITKIEPGRVETHLNFIEPFSGQADAFVNLTEAGAGTKVTWGFDSRYPYPMNVMLLFINMDELIGKDYNAGLEKLKRLSESH